jgi:hypothetical protein
MCLYLFVHFQFIMICSFEHPLYPLPSSPLFPLLLSLIYAHLIYVIAIVSPLSKPLQVFPVWNTGQVSIHSHFNGECNSCLLKRRLISSWTIRWLVPCYQGWLEFLNWTNFTSVTSHKSLWTWLHNIHSHHMSHLVNLWSNWYSIAVVLSCWQLFLPYHLLSCLRLASRVSLWPILRAMSYSYSCPVHAMNNTI